MDREQDVERTGEGRFTSILSCFGLHATAIGRPTAKQLELQIFELRFFKRLERKNENELGNKKKKTEIVRTHATRVRNAGAP